ncbi:hypothetical protein [Flavobacterium johnsoniae]|uniref:YhhN-like protein n=1 Tax=Flavobacterium johnsoniae TaxID=986 RepID=A0A1J7BZ75_FLAJO|nr:hypothetical protein [Flavobacterium johnsoniae]OIV43915.1 hypothetical protein BKM63_01565 [Flavobacterium johnsoniae]
MIDFLMYLTYFVLFINLIVYSYSFFRKGKANVFFVSYIIFSAAMQFSMELLYQFGKTNLVVVNIFFIGQMILLGMFYNSLTLVKSQKIFIKISLAIALLVLAIQFSMNPNEFIKFNLFEITLTNLLIVVFALFHFYNMLTETKSYYYISIGVVFYLLASTVLYLIGNLSVELSDDLKLLTWILNSFLVLCFQFFILFDWIKSFSSKNALTK